MADPASVLLPSGSRGIPLALVTKAGWKAMKGRLSTAVRAWAVANDFNGEAGRFLAVPGKGNGLERVLAGLGEMPGSEPFAAARLCRALPAGTYALDGFAADGRLIALGWCLEAYEFRTYGKVPGTTAKLVCPDGAERGEILRAAAATYLVRDLVNTPASDMGPDELEAAARAVAKSHRAKVNVIRGRALAKGFPMIHAVGSASPRAPRLIDLAWGPARAPKVTLVGKGVCFDTGGLDIKAAAGMLLMKKDMGGAANVLGLAQMIMSAKLPIRLRVLIPAVENAISGNAFRPGDVLTSRKGFTVEIGNTDAEGRLVLADALALADEEKPDLIVDMATLTGAARVALGPDLPPYYTDDDDIAGAIASAAAAENDPLWRMPLWQPYNRLFDSSIADMSNSGETSFAGSITAALFLKRFIEKAKAYVHFDIFAWTPVTRPGRPKGGEAQGMRALFTMIRERYAKPLAK